MAYVTDAELLTYFADQLRLAGRSNELVASYGNLATHANAFAYGEIRGRLLFDGYRSQDIDAWDRREEYSLDLGVWFLLRNGASLSADDTWPNKFDRRDELDGVIVLVNDLVVLPTGNAAIGHGRLTVYSAFDPIVSDKL